MDLRFVWLIFELHSHLFGLKDSDMGPLNGYGDNLFTNEEFNKKISYHFKSNKTATTSVFTTAGWTM